LFAAEAQAFMLGHIHRQQAWDCDARSGQQRIAYAGSSGRFHHGEDGDKGWLLWEVSATSAVCILQPTPARRTVDIVFDGKPNLGALRDVVAQQDIAGAFVRVRWTVADEDRHEVNREAIQQALGLAAEVKLEGRIVPVVRIRAAGISQLASLEQKVVAWAQAAGVQNAGLLRCLDELVCSQPDEIAGRILEAKFLSCGDGGIEGV
jgi:exonuclease SbcD